MQTLCHKLFANQNSKRIQREHSRIFGINLRAEVGNTGLQREYPAQDMKRFALLEGMGEDRKEFIHLHQAEGQGQATPKCATLACKLF